MDSRLQTLVLIPIIGLVAGASLWVPIGQAQQVEASQGLAELRQRLRDPRLPVRLQTSLLLAKELDAEAVEVLIDLLLDCSPEQRQQIEGTLRELAGTWVPNLTEAGEDGKARRRRRDAWASWWKHTDGPALLDAFRQQTRSKADLDRVQVLICQLGDDAFAVRQRASKELLAYGRSILPVLQEAQVRANLDVEQRLRLGRCLTSIRSKESQSLAPAARLVALRKPVGAVEVLLGVLPWTEDPDLADEVQRALTILAVADGKVDPALLRGLNDPLAARRAVAAEVVAGLGEARHRPALHKLLSDPDLAVRLCLAVSLAQAGDSAAVPTLLELAATSAQQQAWHADDVLRRLAGAEAPSVRLEQEPASRGLYRAAWQRWLRQHGGTGGRDRARPTATRQPQVVATASKSGKKDTPDRAFDGDRKTAWNSAGFVPQWIEADLGASTELASIVLVVNQHPAGDTTHEVWVSNDPIGEQRESARRVHVFKGSTRSQQELRLVFPQGLFARHVQVRTTESVGWVAWMEIDLRVGRSRLSFVPGPGRWRK